MQDYIKTEAVVENGKMKDQVAMMEMNRAFSNNEKQLEMLRDENAIQKLGVKNTNLLLLLM